MRTGVAIAITLLVAARASGASDAEGAPLLEVYTGQQPSSLLLQMADFPTSLTDVLGPMDVREAWAEYELGGAMFRCGMWEESAALHQHALAIHTVQVPRNDAAIGVLKHRLAMSLCWMDRVAEAAALADEAQSGLEASCDRRGELYLDGLVNRGAIAALANDNIGSLVQLNRMRDLACALGPPEPPYHDAYLSYSLTPLCNLQLWSSVRACAEAWEESAAVRPMPDKKALADANLLLCRAADAEGRHEDALDAGAGRLYWAESPEDVENAESWMVHCQRQRGYDDLSFLELLSTLERLERRTWNSPHSLCRELHSIAGAYEEAGKLAEAEAVLRLEFQFMGERLGALPSPLAGTTPTLDDVYMSLARVCRVQGRLEEALTLFASAAQARESHLDAHDPRIEQSLLWFAHVRGEVGWNNISMPELYRGLDALVRGRWKAPQWLVENLDWIARGLVDAGRYDQAECTLRVLLAVRAELFPNEKDELLRVRARLADTIASQGRKREPIDLHLLALAERESTLGPHSRQVAESLDALIPLMRAEQRFAECAKLAEQRLVLAEVNDEWGPVDLIHVTLWLADDSLRADQPERALPHLEQALELARADPALAAAHLYKLSYHLARCHMDLEHVDEAKHYFRLARSCASQRFGPRSIQVAWMCGWEAETNAIDDRNRAETVALRLTKLAILQDVASTDTAALADVTSEVASAYLHLREPDTAIEYLQRALALQEKCPAPDKAELIRLNSMIGKLLKARGYTRDSKPYLEAADRLSVTP